MKTGRARIPSLLLAGVLILTGCGRDSEHLDYARNLIESERYQEAVQVLERGMEVRTGSHDAYFLLGTAHHELGNHEKALDAFRRALQLAKSDPEVQMSLAKTYEALGEPKRALEQYLAVLQSPVAEQWLPTIASATGDRHPVRQVTSDPSDNYDPVFTPDGDQMVIVSFRTQNGELFLINLDGEVQNRLTRTETENESSPTFGGREEWVICSSTPNETQQMQLLLQESGSTAADGDLDRVNIRSRRSRPALPGVSKGNKPAASPDGSKLAFESVRDGNLEIYVADRDSGEITRLTEHPGDDGSPNFSPDGSQIAFVSSRHGNYEIYSIPTEGGSPRRLTHNDVGDYDPVFSPNGRSIAFVSSIGNDKEVYRLDLETKLLERLTHARGASVQPTFSPDGNSLAFVSDRGDFFQIYLMDLTRYPTVDDLVQRIMGALQ